MDLSVDSGHLFINEFLRNDHRLCLALSLDKNNSHVPYFLEGVFLIFINFSKILINIYNKKQKSNCIGYGLLEMQSECPLTR